MAYVVEAVLNVSGGYQMHNAHCQKKLLIRKGGRYTKERLPLPLTLCSRLDYEIFLCIEIGFLFRCFMFTPPTRQRPFWGCSERKGCWKRLIWT